MNRLKKYNSLFFFIIAVLIICSCNPKISTSLSKQYPPLYYKQEVMVLGINQEVPPGAEDIGQVKIGDAGFTIRCGYELVIDKAKLEARKVGGNAIKIIKHKPPSILGSSCHRITAKILRIENIDTLNTGREVEFPEDADYALIHIYRYKGAGAIVNYDIFLGNDVICRVKNNYKTTVRVTKEGLNMLWAKTESKTGIPVNIEFGKTYYLRCGLNVGAFVGRPILELVDEKTGKIEFESFNP